MDEDAVRLAEAQGFKEHRPIDRVEARDVRADDMDDLSLGIVPEILEAGIVFLEITQGGDVVGQGVQPNINHVFGVFQNLNAPIEGGAGNA